MKNLLISTLFSLLAISFTTTVAANEGARIKEAVSLKYNGSIENKPVFELAVSNTENSNLLLTIVDEFGTVLHKEAIKSSNFKKQFLLDNEDGEPIEVFYFRITDRKTNEFVEYQASQKIVRNYTESTFSIAKS